MVIKKIDQNAPPASDKCKTFFSRLDTITYKSSFVLYFLSVQLLEKDKKVALGLCQYDHYIKPFIYLAE